MSEERMTIATVDVCPCGLVMHQGDEDDYDTGGAESGICCPDCGNEKFTTVQQLQAELHTTAKQIGWLKGDKARLSKSIQVRDNAITALIEVHEAELATAEAENEDLCDNIDAVRQERAEYLAGTLEGKLRDEIKQLRAENERLKEFARPVIHQECWSIFEQDGYDLEMLAEKLGLIVPHVVKVDDDYDIDNEVGDKIFIFSDILKESDK